MTTPSLSLIVIRAVKPAELARFYELFGCVFQIEQHGKGPEHFTTSLAGTLLEIYPRGTNSPATAALRLGFVVADLDGVLSQIEAAGVRIIDPAKATQWGRRAVILDPEGHHIEISECV